MAQAYLRRASPKVFVSTWASFILSATVERIFRPRLHLNKPEFMHIMSVTNRLASSTKSTDLSKSCWLIVATFRSQASFTQSVKPITGQSSSRTALEFQDPNAQAAVARRLRVRAREGGVTEARRREGADQVRHVIELVGQWDCAY